MNGGYSWTNTSQWSQVPTTPIDPNSQNKPTQQVQPMAGTQQGNTGGYQQPGQAQPTMQSTPQEPRRDMITRLYKSILSREPDNAGLNYYLFNANIPEAQIAREMYESTEHQEIVSRSKDVREMIKKLEDYSRENSELKTKLQNAESLNANYKILIDQKTQIINSMKSSESNTTVDSQQSSPQNSQHNQKNPQEQGLLLEDPFATEGNQGKGCIGWVKSIFKFS